REGRDGVVSTRPQHVVSAGRRAPADGGPALPVARTAGNLRVAQSRPAVNRGIQPQTPPDRPGRAAGRPGAHRPDPVVDWPGSRGPIAFLPAAGDGAHGAAVRSHRTNLVCRRGHDGLRPALPPVAPRQVDRLADEAPWTLHAQAKAGEASFFLEGSMACSSTLVSSRSV